MARKPHNPYGAYETAQSSALPPRQAEAAAFSRAATLLESVTQESVDRAVLEAALKKNQKLWTVIQLELTREDHPMPLEIRRNLLDLSVFVDRQSLKAMISGSPDDIRPLININREIALGLMG